MVTAGSMLTVRDLHVWYGDKEAIRGISLDIRPREIFSIIGPAHSGKSSFLRVLNRTIELIPGAKVKGEVMLDGRDIRKIRDVCAYRRRIGIVTPLPVGLPITIYDNVAFAPRMAGLRDRADLDGRVERCLRQAALWDEVKDRLHTLGTKLSGGQQQRLTIARALSHDPEILCLDEFSIAIDPVTTSRIEDVLRELKSQITIVLVTNLVHQARRLADRTAFMFNGELVEVNDTETVFSGHPADRRTLDYISGVFG